MTARLTLLQLCQFQKWTARWLLVLLLAGASFTVTGCGKDAPPPADAPASGTSPAVITPGAINSSPATNETYLDDLAEQKFDVNQCEPIFGKHGSTGYAAPDVQRCRLEGKVLTHSLSMAPPDSDRGCAYVTYSLGRKFDLFRGSAAINSAVPDDGLDNAKRFQWNGMAVSPVRFRIFGDGKLLWESCPLQKHGDSEACEVSIKGTEQLRLEVQCAGKANFAWAFWGDPRVQQRAASTSSSSDMDITRTEYPTPPSAPAGKPFRQELSTIVAAIEPAVIRIDVDTNDGKAVGSGFVVSAEGVAVTNFHVVEGAKRATATFRNDAKLEVAGVLGFDAELDIAILKINSPGKMEIVSLSTEQPRKGESVVAFGAPKGLSFSVTDGIVSAVRAGKELAEFGGNDKGTWIQTSAPISGGNSGGPLVNMAGKVVGMNTLAFKNAQNVNFAISAADIRGMLDKSAGASIQPLPEIAFLSRESRSPRVATTATPFTDSSRSAKAVEFVRKLQEERDVRLKECEDAEIAIEKAKELLKAAILSGDTAAEKPHRTQISRLRAAIKRKIGEPLPLRRLKLNELTTDDVGLVEASVKIIQVIEKNRGECIAIPFHALNPRDQALWLVGMDLTSVVDQDVIALKDLVFEVAGTKTYTTKNATNTVFVLQVALSTRDLTDLLRVDFKSRMIDDEPEFSPDEKKQLANASAQAKAAKAESAADSKLRAAESLLKVGKADAYRKILKEIVEQFPLTEAAAKAKRALN